MSNSSLSCGDDPELSSISLTSIRSSHPLLIAPDYKWSCLPKLIAADSYMSYWNDTVFSNATKFYDLAPTNYTEDGGLSGSGVLDVAREVQLRIKHWGYAYKLTNDTKWVDRTWQELLVRLRFSLLSFSVSDTDCYPPSLLRHLVDRLR
jgi:hypothetical protein